MNEQAYIDTLQALQEENETLKQQNEFFAKKVYRMAEKSRIARERKEKGRFTKIYWKKIREIIENNVLKPTTEAVMFRLLCYVRLDNFIGDDQGKYSLKQIHEKIIQNMVSYRQMLRIIDELSYYGVLTQVNQGKYTYIHIPTHLAECKCIWQSKNADFGN
ncbi:hypothetical protein [Sporolituus thermophilus]|uniref:Uncharacterized protein n=1 Tax=Sporolituus thermophilus DSM 23256 TaxID=1123285 RepID=A0A1G7KX73_9FIRM|nr:hypothetical protein [Sporolituus thermophilus]SDF41838.1 hypothetical protein SAMN05660235_01503 [Sporolituus thermophilus DSM 23256]